MNDEAFVVDLEALVQEGYTVQVSAYGTGLRRRRVVATRGVDSRYGCGRSLLEAIQVCGRQVDRLESKGDRS